MESLVVCESGAFSRPRWFVSVVGGKLAPGQYRDVAGPFPTAEEAEHALAEIVDREPDQYRRR